MFASVAFNPFLPAFSLAYQHGELKRFRNMFHKSLVVLAAMCLVVTLGAVLFGKVGLKILFGPDILEHYGLFLPIVWCTILTALIWILSSLVVALRSPRRRRFSRRGCPRPRLWRRRCPYRRR